MNAADSLPALALAFGLCFLLASVYRATGDGRPRRRELAQSLALGGIVSALVMLAVHDEVARGLGAMGALSVIRFRSTLKDTRDLIFSFASLALGVACGVRAFTVAISGGLVFLVAALLLHWLRFGTHAEPRAVLATVSAAPDDRTVGLGGERA
jgi:hypothetical protein